MLHLGDDDRKYQCESRNSYISSGCQSRVNKPLARPLTVIRP